MGERREELTEILRSRLIECGWRDQVANMCRNLIQKHGVDQIRIEQMISEVRPKARQSVPEHVKLELLEMIRKLDVSQLQPNIRKDQEMQPVEVTNTLTSSQDQQSQPLETAATITTVTPVTTPPTIAELPNEGDSIL